MNELEHKQHIIKLVNRLVVLFAALLVAFILVYVYMGISKGTDQKADLAQDQTSENEKTEVYFNEVQELFPQYATIDEKRMIILSTVNSRQPLSLLVKDQISREISTQDKYYQFSTTEKNSIIKAINQ